MSAPGLVPANITPPVEILNLVHYFLSTPVHIKLTTIKLSNIIVRWRFIKTRRQVTTIILLQASLV